MLVGLWLPIFSCCRINPSPNFRSIKPIDSVLKIWVTPRVGRMGRGHRAEVAALGEWRESWVWGWEARQSRDFCLQMCSQARFPRTAWAPALPWAWTSVPASWAALCSFTSLGLCTRASQRWGPPWPLCVNSHLCPPVPCPPSLLCSLGHFLPFDTPYVLCVWL